MSSGTGEPFRTVHRLQRLQYRHESLCTWTQPRSQGGSERTRAPRPGRAALDPRAQWSVLHTHTSWRSLLLDGWLIAVLSLQATCGGLKMVPGPGIGPDPPPRTDRHVSGHLLRAGKCMSAMPFGSLRNGRANRGGSEAAVAIDRRSDGLQLRAAAVHPPEASGTRPPAAGLSAGSLHRTLCRRRRPSSPPARHRWRS